MIKKRKGRQQHTYAPVTVINLDRLIKLSLEAFEDTN